MSGASKFHDENAEAFLRQYRADIDFTDRLAAWAALLDRFAIRGGRALDLGSGGGSLSFALAAYGMTVLGVDGSPEMVRRSEAERARLGVRDVTFRHLELPAAVPGAPFDFVMASSLVEYLPDTPAVDHWLADLVAPGGILVFSLPNRQSLYRQLERLTFRLTGKPAYRAHVQRLSTPEETTSRFTGLGLALQQVRYYAARPVLSRLARTCLPARRSDNLFVVVFRRSS